MVEAARTRLRPILMTSFAFILGVIPLAVAKGAGAEMRVPLGVAVASGMLGVTFFGLVFTPVFYYVIMWFGGVGKTQAAAQDDPEQTPPAETTGGGLMVSAQPRFADRPKACRPLRTLRAECPRPVRGTVTFAATPRSTNPAEMPPAGYPLGAVEVHAPRSAL